MLSRRRLPPASPVAPCLIGGHPQRGAARKQGGGEQERARRRSSGPWTRRALPTPRPPAIGPAIVAAASATLNAAFPSGISSWGISVDAAAARVMLRATNARTASANASANTSATLERPTISARTMNRHGLDEVQRRQDPPRRGAVDPRNQERPDQPREELGRQEQGGSRERRSGRA